MTFFRSFNAILAVFLLFTIIGGPFIQKSYAAGPDIVGKAGILIDLKSGQVLYEKNPDQQLPPASTTKILTVAVALEEGNLKDKVTASKNAAQAEGSSIYLMEDEVLTLEELLWGVLLESGNDAAVAVAEHISGSESAFAQLMNKKAKEWGATNSNFANPNGLPDDSHYTTARDLALIAKHAMEIPLFREMSVTKVKEIDRIDPKTKSRLINHNKLLWQYEGATGIKTGYTRAAQQCLVSSAKRGDQEFIAVVLGSVGNNIWTDSKRLLDFGFNNFYTKELVQKNKFYCEVEVAEGTEPVKAITEEGIYYTSKLNSKEEPEEKVTILKGLTAPIEKGQKVGYVSYILGGEEVARTYLIAQNSVSEKVIVKQYPWIIPTAGLLVTIIIAATLRKKRRYRRRRSNFSSYYRGPIR